MGNVGSYFSSQPFLEQSIGPIDEAKNNECSHHTPARCNLKPAANTFFDPRSPTLDINRTPIVVVDTADEISEGIEDPRSPSVGIVRTPFAAALPAEVRLEQQPQVVQQGKEDLVQALNFTDLDHLSISNIDGPEDIPEEPLVICQLEPITISEDTIDFSPLVIGASSTPAPSPIKPTKKRASNNQISVDENSFTKKSSNTANLGRPRVPFGEVNRPTASPRHQLQNKQRNQVRAEYLQQRFVIKHD